MPSTYSTNLAIELIGTGDQSGTWGASTNVNLGTLIEQAISGYVTQAITDGADTVITIPNGATGVARNMFIECTGTLTAARNLVVPANRKLYFIFNNTSGGFAVTVKVSGQTGVSVPNGKKMVLVSNGTDIFVATNYVVGDVSGNAGTVTNGVYTTGAQTIAGLKTFSDQTTSTGFTSGGQFNAVAGSASTWYNSMLRNDGSAVYLLSSNVQTTQAAAIAATINAFRPFSWNLSTGAVTIAGSGEAVSFGGGVLIASGTNPDCLSIDSSASNGANFRLTGTSGSPAAPNKYIRSAGGALEIRNSAYTATLMQMLDSGNTTIYGTFATTGSITTPTIATVDNTTKVINSAWANLQPYAAGMTSTLAALTNANTPTLGWAQYTNTSTNTPVASTYGQIYTVSNIASATPSVTNWLQQYAFDTNGTSMYQRQNINNAGWTAWTNSMSTVGPQSITSNASADVLTLSSSASGGANLKLIGTSGSPAAPNKYIRSLAGVLEVINSAYTAPLVQVFDAGDLAFNSGYGSAKVAYGCRAWVNFNGTGTVAIRGSGGVSSITDNGVGDYTVNLAASLVDANYAIGATSNVTVTVFPTPSSSLFRLVTTTTTTGAAFDSAFVYAQVHR